MTSYNVIIPKERQEIDLVHPFPYRLDDFQINGCWAIQNNKNVLITAHTAAGKTTIAEYAIALSKHLNKKVLYTSPIKTLSNQKFFDFKRTFGEVGILTGDIKLNPEANILILTTEILRNKLDYEPEAFSDIHCVIFDEVHYFNDPERGFVWEECITKLPKHILLVMLSATIDKADEFAHWVCNCRERDILLIGTNYRPVPLNHYIFTDKEILLINKHKVGVQSQNVDAAYSYYDKQKLFVNKLISLSDFLRKNKLFPAICFSFSRKKCFEYCQTMKRVDGLLNPEEQKAAKFIVHKVFATNLKYYLDIPSTQQILEMLEYGTAVHHSGLLPIQKELIEILFSRGLIKFLFATETFAVGVNMPTKTVVFTELSKYDGKSDFPRVLRYDEFMQMSGRAGRRGKDEQGYVIYCPLKNLELKHEVLGLLKGKAAKLVSQYDEGANTFLRLLNSPTYNKTDEIRNFYESTLFGLEGAKHLKYMERELLELKDELPEHEIIDKNTEKEVLDLESQILMSRGKTLQRLQKQLEDIKRLNPDFFEVRKQRIQLESNIKTLEEAIESQSKSLETQLAQIAKFNSKLGLVQETSNGVVITPYGKIVASLSNCSEVVMGKIIQQRILEKLDWKMIGVVLACFSDDKPDDDDYWEEAKKHLDRKTIDILDEIWFMYNDIIKVYDEFQIKHRINMFFSFIVPYMNWIEKKPLIEVLKSFDNFDGNFVKNLYKIRDICQEILKVCQNFNLGELQEKINTLLENLIYGIGEFNSLYIHHYQMICDFH